MVKQKRVFLILLSALMILCLACGVWALLPKTAVAAGESISITDDFTTEEMSSLDAVEKYHLVGAGNTTYGAVPGSTWGEYTDGGDAYLVYKVSPDFGYTLSNVKFTPVFKIGHESGRYWHQANFGVPNFLGVNILIYTSTDNATWSLVYDFNTANGGTETQPYIANFQEQQFNPELDFSSSVVEGKDLYIKYFIEHIDSSESVVESERTTGIALDDLGSKIFSITITADQVERTFANVISKNFAQPGSISSFGIYDYDHIAKDTSTGNSDYPIIPAAGWGASVDAGTGWFVYKIALKQNQVFNGLAFSLDASVAHRSIADAINVDRSNVRVYASTTNTNYVKVFDFCEAKGNANCGEAHWESRTTSKIDLSSFGSDSNVVYVKVELVQMPLSTYYPDLSTVPSAIGSTDGKTNLDRLNALVYGVEIEYDTITLDNPNYFIEETFSLMGLQQSDGKTSAIETSNVVSDNYGHTAFGFIPAAGWGATVNAGTGYMVYAVPLKGNGTFVNLSSLRLSIEYYLANANNADLVVSAGFDGSDYSVYSFSVVDSIVNPYNSTHQMLDLDLTSILSKEGALTAENIYIKITMVHDTASVGLDQLGVRLHGVSIYAEQVFVMNEGASIRIKENSNGLRFTSFISKNVYDNLVDTYGAENVSVSMMIAPYDYIETHGAFTVENLFGGSVYNVVMPGGENVENLVNVGAVSSVVTTAGAPDGFYAFSGSITDIKYDNIDREFVGVGIITYNNGEKDVNIVADYANSDAKKVARSAAYIGQMAVVDDSVIGDHKTILQEQYVDKAFGRETTYTVIHTLFNTSSNITDISIVEETSTIGAEVTVTPSTGFDGYGYVESVEINGVTYTSNITGTVLANGRTVFYIYYYTV